MPSASGHRRRRAPRNPGLAWYRVVRVAARSNGELQSTASSEVSASDAIITAPDGELDVACLGEFRVALYDAAREAEQRLVVDLSQVEYIDSSCLGALIELHHRLRREQRELVVVAPGGTAAALVLNLSGLQNRLPTYQTRQAATEHTS